MKNIKYILGIVVAALMGFSSCSDELAQPPMNIPQGGIGSGSWNSPMTAYQVSLGAINDTLQGTWVKGYIVGYIDTGIGNTINDKTAKFTVPAGVKTNVLMAMDSTETDWHNCITVQLPSGAVRNALNLGDHPENLGQMFTILGTTGDKYCGAYGVRSVAYYMKGDMGKEGVTIQPSTPGGDTGSGTVIYSGLPETAETIDWTFENVVVPTGLTNPIWAWKAYNSKYYLNASAYLSSGTSDSEAYAVSPVIDLSGYKSVSFTFDHAAKFQTTIKDLCYPVVREEGSNTWTRLTITTWPGTTSWAFVNAGAMDISAFAGKKVQVGFRYGSSAAGADTWEIKNVKVSGTK